MYKQRSSAQKKITPEHQTVILPNNIDIYERNAGLPSQIRFSNKVKNIIIVPIRAELYMGHLANFLRQHNLQQSFDQDKLGIIFLINDNATDRTNEKVQNENYLTYQYLSLLSQGDNPQIELLNLSYEYKYLSKQIIRRNLLEIRIDYVHSRLSEIHWGKMRLHLLYLVRTFKNVALLDTSIKIHFSDVDTTLSTSHYKTLEEKVYSHDYLKSNINQHDFFPWMYEGEDKENIGRDALLSFDAYRFYHFREQAQLFIKQRLLSGAPTLSARFSVFYEGPKNRLHHELQNLNEYQSDEDYAIGTYLMNKRYGMPIAKRGVGFIGEVYFLYRIRPILYAKDKPITKNNSDAETIYMKITNKNFKVTDSEEYDISSEEDANKYIAALENFFSILNRTPDFTISNEYKDILQLEKKIEQKKVRFRRRMLIKYLHSIQKSRRLEPLEQRMLAPYERYFPDEITDMKAQLNQGITPEEIAESYFRKDEHFVFFNFGASIHTQIAHVRALMRYAFTYGTNERKFILPKN